MARSRDDTQLTLSDMSDDTTSEEENTMMAELKLTEEEKRGTVPYSPQATAVALTLTKATVNPTVTRGPIRRRHKRKNVQKSDKCIQTESSTSPPEKKKTTG